MGSWVRLIILSGFFIIGAIIGLSLALHTHPDPLLSNYLEEYCVVMSKGGLRVSFLEVLWDCVRWPLFVVLLSFTVLGCIGIPVLFAARGFLLSFSICVLSRAVNDGGAILAIVLFSVPVLFVLPTLFILGSNGIQASANRLPNTAPTSVKLFRTENYLICGGILSISAAVQWAVIPSALSAVCSNLLF